MVRTTTDNDEPTTKPEAVTAVADALQSVGYEAEPRPRLGVVNVFDPADASAMYDRVDDATPAGCVIDVQMTTATKFQIDPDVKGFLGGAE